MFVSALIAPGRRESAVAFTSPFWGGTLKLYFGLTRFVHLIRLPWRHGPTLRETRQANRTLHLYILSYEG